MIEAQDGIICLDPHSLTGTDFKTLTETRQAAFASTYL